MPRLWPLSAARDAWSTAPRGWPARRPSTLPRRPSRSPIAARCCSCSTPATSWNAVGRSPATRAAGSCGRSSSLRLGARLVTTFADGSAGSVVDEVATAAPNGGFEQRNCERRRSPMSQPDPVTDSVPVGDLGYADASDELDAIIAELEGGVIDVDLLEVRLRQGGRDRGGARPAGSVERGTGSARSCRGSRPWARTRLARTRAGSGTNSESGPAATSRRAEGVRSPRVQSSRALMAHQPLLERGASFAEALALTPS